MNNTLRAKEALLLQKLRRRSKPLTFVVTLGLLALGLQLPAAHAGLIGTQAVVSAQQAEHDRGRLRALLEREEVRQQLLAAGVDPRHVAARVDGLSDAEVQQLAAKIDELPAGGDAIGALLFVFVVLLITDILGFTDVFPFVKKPVRR